MERPVPDVTGFEPALAGRMLATAACTDADAIPKVADAGTCREHDGRRVQVMHNGLLVEEGGYYGAWMAEVIRALRGHHEPQEEIVFHRILERLAADGGAPAMIEFGSFWMYYGLWFCHAIPAGHAVGLEPDPAWLDVGRRNAALNGYQDRVRFVQAAIGAQPGRPLAFTAESDGRIHDVVQHDLASLMAETGLDHVDLVLADVQGAETVLIDRARGDLEAGRVRFLVVSTHHHTISGDPLTHQNALEQLVAAGAHVIAEHSIGESVSGDGLIAVSFDPRDKDFTVPVTHARYCDSFAGEVEYDLARVTAERDHLRAELDRVHATKLWRWARKPREVYARLTRRS
ncbi:FkbM family methyltransferase [Amycolatopsis australiensis]|uniref:Methyltransferase, FkbM family n=1 Tax=Amycolatopsis australiensis TaxID=546364 RepID=A0A1K1T6B4_9PSEU|nr:FkbM family methyltransferase [Amycolatopsis australiensis]SFW92139.1 methyltransferase, FkbM family [Amycolatopsis australiensis]